VDNTAAGGAALLGEGDDHQGDGGVEDQVRDGHPVLQAVSSGYPNPTRYPVFHLIPDPTRFIFENHRVAGNPKYRVLPEISGKPGVSGITRYIG